MCDIWFDSDCYSYSSTTAGVADSLANYCRVTSLYITSYLFPKKLFLIQIIYLSLLKFFFVLMVRLICLIQITYPSLLKFIFLLMVSLICTLSIRD